MISRASIFICIKIFKTYLASIELVFEGVAIGNLVVCLLIRIEVIHLIIMIYTIRYTHLNSYDCVNISDCDENIFKAVL